MQEVAKGLYRLYDKTVDPTKPILRMWHDCDAEKERKGKKRPAGRPELEDKGKGAFRCSFCAFKYQS